MFHIIRTKRRLKDLRQVFNRGGFTEGYAHEEKQRRIDELAKTESLGHTGWKNHVHAGAAGTGSV